jgi:hypothetical protein
MMFSIGDFLKTVDENNRAHEMALRYAAMILADLKELTQEGRGIMTEALMDLIATKGKEAGVVH